MQGGGEREELREGICRLGRFQSFHGCGRPSAVIERIQGCPTEWEELRCLERLNLALKIMSAQQPIS